ncbi:Uncharacterised protein [Nocardia asteroides]|nr:hypothetical protein SAMN05444423_101363 [Nocardia asteroides]VEG31977.1 Uncharacterised protein [Nocardia asteroides]
MTNRTNKQIPPGRTEFTGTECARRASNQDVNEFEYVLGTGDPLAHPWSGDAESALADTGSAALWLDVTLDAGIDDALWDAERAAAADLAALPDIPLVAVDHRAVLAQDPPGAVSRPPWLDGH